MFRALRADEVELRVATMTAKGASMLLYKDARCDMNILDETVGEMNWQRSHSRDNANCTVSIWDKDKAQWVSKEDTGTESNTEKEKGLASDSFKRACFNWGIGRELYTAPFIWIPADKFDSYDKNGKPALSLSNHFEVDDMTVKDGCITSLKISNTRGGRKEIVFTWSKGESATPVSAQPKVSPPKADTPPEVCEVCGKPVYGAWARKSRDKYGKVYCGAECMKRDMESAPIASNDGDLPF